MMWNSLNGRIFLAFSFIILLIVGLTGGLAWYSTAREFEQYIIEEDRLEAQYLASLLEAHYNFYGNLNDIEGFLGFYDEDFLGDTGFIVEENGEFVEFFVDEAGEIIDEQIITDFYEPSFIEMFPELAWWERVVAANLRLSLVELQTLQKDASIAEISLERDVSPDTLVAAIMAVENARLQDKAFEFPDEAVFYLSDQRFLVEQYIYYSEEYISNTFFDFEYSPIVGDSRVMIVNATGEIVIDTLGIREGERLRNRERLLGVDFINWQTGLVQGTVLVETGADFFLSQERAFLDQMVRSLLIVAAIATAVALIIGVLLSRQISTPIAALTQAVSRLAEEGATERLPMNATNDINQMSAAFNHLADSLENQKQLRQQLVADVSHELNTPLSVIQAEIEAMQYELQTSEEAGQHVLREVKLLHNLARDLTLLAETDRGEMQLSLAELDVETLLQAEVARWQTEAETAVIALTYHSANEALPKIQADPVRLSQVIGNLIRNGIQHTPENGTISVKAANENNDVIIAIKDSGEGIPQEHLAKIFERFYRVDSARQRNSGGRGLGLAIVKDIITLHNGRVWVESHVGEGSTFFIALNGS